MKTFLSILLVAAGLAHAQAQGGYVNGVLVPGYNFCSVPLQAANDSAETVMNALETGDMIMQWNGGGYSACLYIGSGEWYDGSTLDPIPTPQLPGGAGFIYFNAQGHTKTNTYLGVLRPGGSRLLLSGYNFLGSFTPFEGRIDSPYLNLPWGNGDAVLFWDGNGFISYLLFGGTWYDDDLLPVPDPPSVRYAEGFFFQNNHGHAAVWNQPPLIP